ncbi:MAG: hypothetical protein JSV09_00130 [Thermoplasmata archaeon]|nr:MAG: hypothetical protein JSV09_00130 [Thermoplasmata archaeon]
MKKSLAILMLVIALFYFSGFASAGVPTVESYDVFHIEPGEEFEVEVLVICHADVANYTVTVTLHSRFQFAENDSDMVISGINASVTYEGRDTDELFFEFPMVANNNTPDGNYNIQYEVYWNGSETGFVPTFVERDTVRVSVREGEESPCSSTSFIILPLFAVGMAYPAFKGLKGDFNGTKGFFKRKN